MMRLIDMKYLQCVKIFYVQEKINDVDIEAEGSGATEDNSR